MWTYLHFDEDGNRSGGELPPQRSVVLVFEELRWRVMVGYLEPGSGEGITSVFAPNLQDDCTWLAWSPLSETADPDMKRIESEACQPKGGAGYREHKVPELVR